MAFHQAPLHLALLISPLYLLLQFLLAKKSFDRRSVLELSAKLGPRKPPLLLKVEDFLLTALFQLSKGRIMPYVILKGLAEAIPWSEATRKWFSLHERACCYLIVGASTYSALKDH